MGLFFGSTSDKYSSKERFLSNKDLENLVSSIKIRSLDKNEEALVEQALGAHRGRDGKTSLRQVYEALHELRNKNKISKFDEKELMKIFINYFSKFDK